MVHCQTYRESHNHENELLRDFSEELHGEDDEGDGAHRDQQSPETDLVPVGDDHPKYEHRVLVLYTQSS